MKQTPECVAIEPFTAIGFPRPAAIVGGFVLASLLAISCSARADDTLWLLEGDRLALETRLELIDTATHRISLSTYHIEPGQATKLLLGALQRAAGRGVDVRLLLDGLNMELPTERLLQLQQHGVAVRLFHPRGSGRLDWLNRRLHSKLLVVDRYQVITGSRNLRDKHFGLDSTNYIDCDAHLTGASADHATDYFDWLWGLSDVLDFEQTGRRSIGAKADRPNANSCDTTHLTFRSLPTDTAICDRPAEAVPEIVACWLHDADVRKSQHRMQREIVRRIEHARSSLVIETPYAAFSKPVRSVIQEAARRGVKVQIFTNSLSTTDRKIAYAAFQNEKRRLMRAGVRLYEYSGSDRLHFKLMLVDERCAILGSHNFDARSDNFNLELCLCIDDRRVARQLKTRLCRQLPLFEELARPGLRKSGPNASVSIPLRVRLRASQTLAPWLRPLL